MVDAFDMFEQPRVGRPRRQVELGWASLHEADAHEADAITRDAAVCVFYDPAVLVCALLLDRPRPLTEAAHVRGYTYDADTRTAPTFTSRVYPSAEALQAEYHAHLIAEEEERRRTEERRRGEAEQTRKRRDMIKIAAAAQRAGRERARRQRAPRPPCPSLLLLNTYEIKPRADGYGVVFHVDATRSQFLGVAWYDVTAGVWLLNDDYVDDPALEAALSAARGELR